MKSTSQQQPRPPCECQQQFGDAVPWLAVTLAIIFVINRRNGRRQKKDTEMVGISDAGAAHGGNR
jgi:hypothetical protein